MDTLKKIEETLEGALMSVRALRPQLSLPDEEMGVKQACAKLYAELGNDWSMSLSFDPSYHEEGRVHTEFSVWDNALKQHFKAPSMTAAVNACLAAHVPEPPDPLGEAARLIPTLAAK